MNIGVGVVTRNRPKHLKNLLYSLVQCKSDINELIVVNDGEQIDDLKHFNTSNLDITWVQNPKNIGVGKSKNKAMQHLLDKGCDYIFILEDDIEITNSDIFNNYIKASKITGIQHFNFGPGTPFNRTQNITRYDLHNRHLLSNISKPNPKITIQYSSDVSIDLYEHIAGVFSFFTREILLAVGLHDDIFFNAWEHVDHTYRIIKANGHPAFWWFADITDSSTMITIPSDAIDTSVTSKNTDEWYDTVNIGREAYRKKHGFYPNMCPLDTKQTIIQQLKEIKNKWKI
jgi:GT2 family glycosyltransferase